MDAVGFSGLLLFVLPFMIATRIGMWMLFKKAGKNPWLAIIPFVSWFTWIKIVNRPVWWIVLLLIPAVNVIVWYSLTIDLLKSFGRFKFGEQVMGILFPFAYFPYMGFKKEIVYLGPSHSEDFKKKYDPKARNVRREWADAIFFAVVVAYLIRGFFIEPYKIPTSSMEKSMMVGDFLFVSKINYGARIPITPLAIPFAHQYLPFDIKAYSDAVELPYLRLPGFQRIKHNDPVVFNVPWDWLDPTPRPADKMQNYVKRCVGMPGDRIEIIEGQLHINGKASENPKEFQHNYFVKFKDMLPDDDALVNDADMYDFYDFRYFSPGQPGYTSEPVMVMALTEEKIGMIKSLFNVDTVFWVKDSKAEPKVWINEGHFPLNYSIRLKANAKLSEADKKQIGYIYGVTGAEPSQIHVLLDMSKHGYSNYKNIAAIDTIEALMPGSTGKAFPDTDNGNELFGWNKDNFGPLYLPKRGDKITLDEKSFNQYRRAFLYEGNKDPMWAHGKAYMNGEPVSTYTFKMDYYWMMGDNRDNSLDSRFWGYVPESHIVGKPLFVLMSFQYKNESPQNPQPGVDYNKFIKVRWGRTFHGIK